MVCRQKNTRRFIIMKKILLALVLICSLLLSVVACAQTETETPNGEENNTTSNQTQTGGDGNETDLPTNDDPEENIAYIVESVNQGIDLSGLVDELVGFAKDNAEDLPDTFRTLADSIANAEYEASVNVDYNGQKASVYAGMKDRVLYAEMESGAEKEYAYLFIEDDYTLVSVNEDYSGGYEGSVESSLAEGMANIDATVEQAVAMLDSEEAKQIIDLAKELVKIELPKMTADDITYEDGRYYVSTDYAVDAIKQVVRDAAEKIAEEYPDEIDPDEIDETVDETIDQLLETVEVELWLHMECKTFTGFGAKVTSTDEDMPAEAFVDINGTHIEAKLAMEGDPENAGELSLVVDINVDDTGMFNSAVANFSMDLPYSNYLYDDEWDEESETWQEFYKYITGRQTAQVGVTLALPTEDTNGKVLDVKASYAVTDCVATVTNQQTGEETEVEYADSSYDISAVVNMEGFNKITVDFDLDASDPENDVNIDAAADATIVISDSEITVDFVLDASSNGEDINVTADATVSIGSADNMPEIPQAVIDAKDAALTNYAE